MYNVIQDPTHMDRADTGNLGGRGDMLPNPLAWRFMNEPLWRWFVFVVALGFLLHAWRGVLNYMK